MPHYTDQEGRLYFFEGQARPGLTLLTPEEFVALTAPLPPTKDEQIAHVLATIGKGRDRSLIQTIIMFAEGVSIPKLAADNNVSYEVAKAAAYTRNATYKSAVDCEAACRAIEVAP